jgi:hypothetical protein
VIFYDSGWTGTGSLIFFWEPRLFSWSPPAGPRRKWEITIVGFSLAHESPWRNFKE